MVTQCPVCRRWFRIDREAAQAAHGLARCGECETVFNALATLCDRPPPVRDRLQVQVQESAARVAGGKTAHDDGTADEHAAADVALAPLLETQVARGRRAQRLWGLAAALAALALTAQCIHAERYAIARVPFAGPALRAVYRSFGSSLDDRLVLGRYAIARAALEAVPDSARAIELDGRLVNRASFAQRLPLLRLSLKNRRGEVLGSRLLLPSDYGATTMVTLAAKRAFRFHVKLADPGADATGFTLVLCKRRASRVVCRGS